MKELLISQIAPILATAVVAILVVIVKSVGSVAIDVLAKKKEQIEQSLIASGHEKDLQTAKEVWNIIEEKFRITENISEVLGSKADEFNKLLLQRIPGLSQQNLDDLRQAIAGEFNQGKAAALNQTDALMQLQDSNTQLMAENVALKNQLNQVQSVVLANRNTDQQVTA